MEKYKPINSGDLYLETLRSLILDNRVAGKLYNQTRRIGYHVNREYYNPNEIKVETLRAIYRKPDLKKFRTNRVVRDSVERIKEALELYFLVADLLPETSDQLSE